MYDGIPEDSSFILEWILEATHNSGEGSNGNPDQEDQNAEDYFELTSFTKDEQHLVKKVGKTRVEDLPKLILLQSAEDVQIFEGDLEHGKVVQKWLDKHV